MTLSEESIVRIEYRILRMIEEIKLRRERDKQHSNEISTFVNQHVDKERKLEEEIQILKRKLDTISSDFQQNTIDLEKYKGLLLAEKDKNIALKTIHQQEIHLLKEITIENQKSTLLVENELNDIKIRYEIIKESASAVSNQINELTHNYNNIRNTINNLQSTFVSFTESVAYYENELIKIKKDNEKNNCTESLWKLRYEDLQKKNNLLRVFEDLISQNSSIETFLIDYKTLQMKFQQELLRNQQNKQHIDQLNNYVKILETKNQTYHNFLTNNNKESKELVQKISTI